MFGRAAVGLLGWRFERKSDAGQGGASPGEEAETGRVGAATTSSDSERVDKDSGGGVVYQLLCQLVTSQPDRIYSQAALPLPMAAACRCAGRGGTRRQPGRTAKRNMPVIDSSDEEEMGTSNGEEDAGGNEDDDDDESDETSDVEAQRKRRRRGREEPTGRRRNEFNEEGWD